MIQNWEKKKIWSFILFLAIIFVGITSQEAISQTKGGVEASYKGATIKFVVPYGPGGGYDLWARILAPPMKKYTGANVVVENMSGAAGLVGGGHLYSLAKPDGRTIGIMPIPGMVLTEMLGFEGVKYSMEKFSYIGRVDVTDRGIFVKKGSPFKSITDMQKATKPIRWSTVDPTSEATVEKSLISEACGLNSKIIPGYKGSRESLLALIAGREIDAWSTPISGAEEYMKTGDITLIAVISTKRLPAFPDIPTVYETPGLKPEGKKLIELINILYEGGRMIIAPPGMPEGKHLFLEKALLASLKEPAVMDWAQKGGYNISPLSGKGCKELISRLMEIVPKSERPKLKHIATEKYF